MLNYKLQNNLQDMNYQGGVSSDVFYSKGNDGFNIDNDTHTDLYNRKKAWAELEREQDEVKNNIKSLMRRAPESNEIENPLLAERISPKKPDTNYKVPQDVLLEAKHKQTFDNFVQ